MKKLWDNSPKEKKQFILNVFDINPSDIQILNSRDIILFTQQFSDDHYLTVDEQITLYKKILSNYDQTKVIIKPHPRDSIDYKKKFPGIAVFEKIAPMQLLDLLDIHFKIAVTISSSAVLSIPYKLKIDWYGSRIHPKLLKIEGDRRLEDLLLNT